LHLLQAGAVKSLTTSVFRSSQKEHPSLLAHLAGSTIAALLNMSWQPIVS